VSFSLLCDATLGRHAALAGLDAVLANHHESAHGVRHLAIVELRPLGIQSMPDLVRASWMRATETLCRLRDEYSQNPKLYQLCCACAGLLTGRSCSSSLTAPRTRYCGCQPRAVLVSCRRYFRNADCSRRARYGQRLCVVSSRGPCSGHKGQQRCASESLILGRLRVESRGKVGTIDKCRWKSRVAHPVRLTYLDLLFVHILRLR
jgi:hypothetical protein